MLEGSSSSSFGVVNVLERAARQSSTRNGRVAGVALDGSKAWSMTHEEHEPWWECHLGEVFELNRVIFRIRTRGKYYVFASRSPLKRVKIHEAKQLALRYSLFTRRDDDEDPVVVWDVPPDTRASWIRIQAKGFRTLQLSQVIFKRTSTSSGTQRRRQPRLKKIDSPDPPHTVAGFYRTQSRELVVRSVQPNDLALSRVHRSKTLRDVTVGLRRSKSCFDAHKVDQLYWRALLRYEKQQAAEREITAILGSFSPHQLDWIRILFALCRAQVERKLRAFIPRSLTGDILERVLNTPTPTTHFDSDDNSKQFLQENSILESGTAQVRCVYSCLRKVAEGLALQENRSHGHSSSSKPIDVALTEIGMDATSTASVARDVSRLVRLDETDLSLKDFTTVFSAKDSSPPVDSSQPHDECFLSDVSAMSQSNSSRYGNAGDESLRLQVSFPQFVALFGVVRDRTRGIRNEDEIAQALCLESDEVAIEPLATQQRQDRLRLAAAHKPPIVVDRSVSPRVSSLGTSFFKQHPARTKLTTAEAKFRRVAKLSRADEHDETTRDEGAGYYRADAERRRRHQRELSAKARAKTPGIEVQSFKKSCGLCLARFHNDSFGATVARELIIELLKRLGLDSARVEARGGSSALAFTRLNICIFCAQFFDCESADGLAVNKTTRQKDNTTVLANCQALEPFFDLRYPSTLNNVQSRALEKHRRRRPKTS